MVTTVGLDWIGRDAYTLTIAPDIGLPAESWTIPLKLSPIAWQVRSIGIANPMIAQQNTNRTRSNVTSNMRFPLSRLHCVPSPLSERRYLFCGTIFSGGSINCRSMIMTTSVSPALHTFRTNKCHRLSVVGDWACT